MNQPSKSDDLLRRELKKALEALKNEQARGVHTCHAHCTRPMCVMRRELTEARALLQQSIENPGDTQTVERIIAFLDEAAP